MMSGDDDDSNEGFPIDDESRIKKYERELEERKREQQQEEIERRNREA